MIVARDLSSAWLQTLRTVRAARGGVMFHVVTQIEAPLPERKDVRDAADALLTAMGRPSVRTVANTIFPQAMAAVSRDSTQLAERYTAAYSIIRGLDKGNMYGTYFGRLVAYPRGENAQDQLTPLINKLRRELAVTAPKTARYEVGIAAPEDVANDDGDVGAGGGDLQVYIPGQDNRALAFPCLSSCSFQLDGDRLHLAAMYRSQFLVQRGYGNYLGLANLQAYIAGEAGLTPGRLTVLAGRARADVTVRAIATYTGAINLFWN
jgi:hypothetical protein